ncbi:hypothetical protein Zmor_025480 [Zophobas morio]|uniref:Uncharacterized protein n=1 Tax=Zophobas morio TaxID=2755281 RepID=A0AA38HTM6_9CUCU|nr:hypothetical protein Zmor_025480 [Zophobas morio]
MRSILATRWRAARPSTKTKSASTEKKPRFRNPSSHLKPPETLQIFLPFQNDTATSGPPETPHNLANKMAAGRQGRLVLYRFWSRAEGARRPPRRFCCNAVNNFRFKCAKL